MRPLHQRCLEEERLQIARGRLFVLRWTQPKYLLSLRVDELFFRVTVDSLDKVKDVAGHLPPRRTVAHQKASRSHATG